MKQESGKVITLKKFWSVTGTLALSLALAAQTESVAKAEEVLVEPDVATAAASAQPAKIVLSARETLLQFNAQAYERFIGSLAIVGPSVTDQERDAAHFKPTFMSESARERAAKNAGRHAVALFAARLDPREAARLGGALTAPAQKAARALEDANDKLRRAEVAEGYGRDVVERAGEDIAGTNRDPRLVARLRAAEGELAKLRRTRELAKSHFTRCFAEFDRTNAPLGERVDRERAAQVRSAAEQRFLDDQESSDKVDADRAQQVNEKVDAAVKLINEAAGLLKSAVDSPSEDQVARDTANYRAAQATFSAGKACERWANAVDGDDKRVEKACRVTWENVEAVMNGRAAVESVAVSELGELKKQTAAAKAVCLEATQALDMARAAVRQAEQDRDAAQITSLKQEVERVESTYPAIKERLVVAEESERKFEEALAAFATTSRKLESPFIIL